ncbi:hypothetical protein KXS11_17220 [Plantibacter flavus]|uniref:hypothetical protein n=1 Tax=Plantibacter flavus TaxID=150123 RepID=UPI003F15C5C0
MGLGRYLKTRPDIFRPERSPIRTTIWVLVALVGIGIGVLAIVNPEAFVRGGREGVGVRGGLGMIIAPLILVGIGIVGIIWWSRRWRTPGGGKMKVAIQQQFSSTDPAEVWAMLETVTSTSDPALQNLLTRIYRDQAMPGTFALDVMHSPEDRVLVAMVTRHVLKKAGDPNSGMNNQLEREPVVRTGTAYIDFSGPASAAKASI